MIYVYWMKINWKIFKSYRKLSEIPIKYKSSDKGKNTSGFMFSVLHAFHVFTVNYINYKCNINRAKHCKFTYLFIIFQDVLDLISKFVVQ